MTASNKRQSKVFRNGINQSECNALIAMRTYKGEGLMNGPRISRFGPRSRQLQIVIITGLALILIFSLGYWPRRQLVQAAPEDGAAAIPTVTYVAAKRTKADSELLLPATVVGLQETTIYARTNGYLKRWLVDIGDHVNTGQLLAEIETPETDQELQQANASLGQVQANLELARTTAERYRSLLKSEAVSPQEVDERVGAYEARKADLAAMQAQIRRLQEMKGFSRVTAPFAGTISARNVDIGSLIAAGSASANGWLFRLVQTDPLRVLVNVPQNQMQLVRVGATADVLIRELPGKLFSGKVARTSGAFDPATRTMLVDLRVPNPKGELYTGMYAQARFHLQNMEPPIVVSGNALIVSGEGAKLAVLDTGDVVRIRKIRLGRDYGKDVEIVEGLREGERIVINPRDTLKDGMKVKAVIAETAAKSETTKAGSGGDKGKAL